MKKSRIILVIFLAVVAVILKTQTNLWRTEIKYLWGDRIETPYVLFREHGTEILYDKDGWKKLELFYEHGKQYKSIEYQADGAKRRETPYVDGEPHGTETWYEGDGSKRSEKTYVNGVLEGMWVKYWRKGVKCREKPFVNGKLHGTQVEYNLFGSKVSEIVWQNALEVSRRRFFYYLDGTTKRGECPYVKGKKHGTEIGCHEDGSKKSEITYVDGKRHGTGIGYRKDGSKSSETTYKDGYKDGLTIGWYENGQKGGESIFKDGQANLCGCLEAEWRKVSCYQCREREWGGGYVQRGRDGKNSPYLQGRQKSLRLKLPEGVPNKPTPPLT